MCIYGSPKTYVYILYVKRYSDFTILFLIHSHLKKDQSYFYLAAGLLPFKYKTRLAARVALNGKAIILKGVYMYVTYI